MNDFDDFSRRLRGTDDYTKHQRALLAALLFALFGSLGGNFRIGMGGSGVCLIACALYAIRSGKSAVMGVSNDPENADWTDAAFESTSPTDPARHTDRTAAHLILIGLLFLAIAVFA